MQLVAHLTEEPVVESDHEIFLSFPLSTDSRRADSDTGEKMGT